MARQKIVVSGLDELLIFIGRIETEEASWDDLDLDKLSVVIPVRVDGEGWDGRFDYRGGRLVLDVQSTLTSVYKEYSGDIFPRDALIKAKSKEKCNLLNIDISGPLQAMVANMPPEYTLAAVITGLAAFGGVGVYRHYVDRCKSRDQKEAVQTAIDAMRDVSLEAVKNGRDITVPMRRYVRSLSNDDTIAVAGGEEMTRLEALFVIPPPKRENDMYFTHCDGVFSLLGVDLKQDTPVLQISQKDRTVKAYFFARVPQAAKAEILAAIDASIDAQTPGTMSLQADCFFTDKTISHCVIRDAGEPRENMRHYSLDDIPSRVRGRDKHLSGFD